MEVIARVLLSLVAIGGAMFALTWLAKRSRVIGGGVLNVRARLPVAKGTSLAVVQVGERFFLVGVGEKGIDLISELDAGDAIPATNEPAPLASNRSGRRVLGTVFAALKDAAALRGGSTAGDRVGPVPAPAARPQLDSASIEVLRSVAQTDGPGTGLLQRLRQMTLRTQLRRPPGAQRL